MTRNFAVKKTPSSKNVSLKGDYRREAFGSKDIGDTYRYYLETKDPVYLRQFLNRFDYSRSQFASDVRPEGKKDIFTLGAMFLKGSEITTGSRSQEWKKYGEALLKCPSLGINSPLRLSKKALIEVVKNRTNKAFDERPLTLLIYAKSDHNGALYLDSNFIDAVIARGFRVDYRECDSDIELAKTLIYSTEKKKARLILLDAHGDKDGIVLGDKHTSSTRITWNDMELFARLKVGRALEPDGTLYLGSCYAGHQRENYENMVNMFSKMFPHAGSVIGNTERSYSTKLLARTSNREIITPTTERLIYQTWPSTEQDLVNLKKVLNLLHNLSKRCGSR